MPVVVAVGGIAVLAESRVVVEAGRVDLGVGQRRAERLGDPASPAGLDRVAVAVLGDDALEQQVPPSWLASLLDAVLEGAGPLLAFGGQAPSTGTGFLQRYSWRSSGAPRSSPGRGPILNRGTPGARPATKTSSISSRRKRSSSSGQLRPTSSNAFLACSWMS